MAASKIKSMIPRGEIDKFVKDNLPSAPQPTEVQERPHKKIALGLLSYDGKILCRTMMCLTQAVMQCAAQGWQFCYVLRESDSMVARGRSFLASQFLQNPECQDATDLVMVDADLTWEGNEFVRLCSHPVDVVGAAYSYKDESGNMPLRWPPNGLVEENGLWKVHAVTPGFFRVTRKALQQIANEMPWLEFIDKGNPEGQKSWMFFDNRHRPNGIWDECYIFCEYWRSCGGTVYLDPDIRLKHIGMKAYGGFTPREWLEKKSRETVKLEAEMPGVPPLKLAGLAVGHQVTLTDEEAFGPIVSGVAA